MLSFAMVLIPVLFSKSKFAKILHMAIYMLKTR